MKIFFAVKVFILALATASLLHAAETSETKFTTIVVKHSSQGEENDAKGLHCKVKFTYPVDCGDEAALQALQRQFVRYAVGEDYAKFAPKEAVRALIDEWKKAYATETAEEEDNTPAHTYEREADVLYQSDTLVQLRVRDYVYTGGAHGMGGSSSYLFHLATGKILKHSDVFKPDSAKKMRKLILPRLLKYWAVESENEVSCEKENVWNAETEFAVTPEGLLVAYSDYELGAYVLGRPEFTIPYAEVLPCLREDTPVHVLAKSM